MADIKYLRADPRRGSRRRDFNFLIKFGHFHKASPPSLPYTKNAGVLYSLAALLACFCVCINADCFRDISRFYYSYQQRALSHQSLSTIIKSRKYRFELLSDMSQGLLIEGLLAARCVGLFKRANYTAHIKFTKHTKTANCNFPPRAPLVFPFILQATHNN